MESIVSLIYTNQKSKIKPKTSAKKRQLSKSWDELLRKWDVKPTQEDKTKSYNPTYPVSFSRSTKHIPSLDSGAGIASKIEAPQYTGDNMIGIGQLHKSNAVPVFKQQDAEDLAKMRRN